MAKYDAVQAAKEFSAGASRGTSTEERNKIASKAGASLNSAINKYIKANPGSDFKTAVAKLTKIAQAARAPGSPTAKSSFVTPTPQATPSNPNKSSVKGPPKMAKPHPTPSETPSRPKSRPTPTATPTPPWMRK